MKKSVATTAVAATLATNLTNGGLLGVRRFFRFVMEQARPH